MPELQMTVTYIRLDTPQDMVEALEQALTNTYFGTITAAADESGDRWILALSTPVRPGNIAAKLTDVLLWDGTQYVVLDEAGFAEKFGGS